MENNMPEPISPPNLVMSQFAISSGPREIALIVGQTRHLVDMATGQPTRQGTEWLASYALSPVTAQQLHEALTNVLCEYEKRFGKIPVDPSVRFDQSDVVKA